MVLLLRKTKRQNLYRIGESRSHVNAVAQENSEFGSGLPTAHIALQHQWGNGHSRSFSLPICQSRARPCGSTARKKMMSAPKTITSRFDMSPEGSVMPSTLSSGCATLLRKIGSSVMKAAPMNDPRMLPTPPMMTMNRILNERSRLNASGSTVPRYVCVKRSAEAAEERDD